MSAPKSLYLSDKQLEGLSVIISDAGQVFLASMVAPIFTGIEKFNFFVLLLGLVATVVCYILSIYLRKNI